MLSTWNTIPLDTIPQKLGTTKNRGKKKQMRRPVHRMGKSRTQRHTKRKLAQFKEENFAVSKRDIHIYMTYVS